MRHISVFKFCYNDIWLWFLPCFGEESKMIYILLIYLSFPCLNTQRWLQKLNQSCVYINRTIQQHSIYITPTRQPLKDGAILGSAERGEVDIDSDVNCTASGNIRKSTTVPIQCEQLPWTWTCVLCILIVDLISKISLVFFGLLCARNYNYNKGPIKVEFLKWKLYIGDCYLLPFYSQYCSRVSNQYWFYLYYC